VLLLSDLSALHDLGAAVTLDLAVALLGTAAVLPAALVAAEEGVRIGSPRRAAVSLRRLAPAARRRLRASTPFRK
jgi:hypothetical protein